MNTTQLDNLELLESKQLILKISGEVQQSNLAEFEENAIAVIESINTDLQTDEDFAETEQNIKSCSLIETRIANARTDAINSTKEIAALINTTTRLEEKFRAMRLRLTGLVKTEKESRKNEIIDEAKNHLSGMLLQSPVRHAFAVDYKAIQEAVKGKRSLDKMRQAVKEVVTAEELRMAGLEQDYQLNISAINKAEANNIGLRFDDKNNLALSPPDTVTAIITSRILQFKVDMQEKAEKERLEKEKAEQNVEIQPPENKTEMPPNPFATWTPPPPPIDQEVIEQPAFAPPPIEKEIKVTAFFRILPEESEYLANKLGRIDGFCGLEISSIK